MVLLAIRREQTMKRFDASYIRHQLHRLFVASMLAVAALALLGKAAHAQPCVGTLEDTPDEIFDFFRREEGAGKNECNDLFGDFFDSYDSEAEVLHNQMHLVCDGAFEDLVLDVCLGNPI